MAEDVFLNEPTMPTKCVAELTMAESSHVLLGGMEGIGVDLIEIKITVM